MYSKHLYCDLVLGSRCKSMIRLLQHRGYIPFLPKNQTELCLLIGWNTRNGTYLNAQCHAACSEMYTYILF
jgi:hypothetical protein